MNIHRTPLRFTREAMHNLVYQQNHTMYERNFGMTAQQMNSNLPLADRSGANDTLNALRSRIGLLDLTSGRLAVALENWNIRQATRTNVD